MIELAFLLSFSSWDRGYTRAVASEHGGSQLRSLLSAKAPKVDAWKLGGCKDAQRQSILIRSWIGITDVPGGDERSLIRAVWAQKKSTIVFWYGRLSLPLIISIV